MNKSEIRIEEFRTGSILLNKSEVDLCKAKGIERYCESRKMGLIECPHGINLDDPYWKDIRGCIGELAFAKLHGRECPFHLNTFHNLPDVYGWEVRCRKETHWDGIIRDPEAGSSKTDPEGKYALIVGIAEPFVMWCVGWITKREVMEHPQRMNWVHDHGNRGEPAFFVPQAKHHKFHYPTATQILKARSIVDLIKANQFAMPPVGF